MQSTDDDITYRDDLSTADYFTFIQPDLPNIAFPVFESIRRQGTLCDVVIQVADEKIRAHRLVLAASIPYFYAMFTHDMAEAKQDQIVIQDIDAGALEALINFAYTGKIQLTVSNVETIMVAASYLNMVIVRDACCQFIKDRFHPTNVFSIRSLADRLSCKDLFSEATKYIELHFNEVSITNEFLQLESDELSEYLANENLCVTGESEVFEALMRWTKYRESRATFLPDLLTHIRLPLLSLHYIADHVANEPVIRNSIPCRDLLDEARDFHLMPERATRSQRLMKPRGCSQPLGLIFAIGGLSVAGESISTVEYYDAITSRWHITSSLATQRSRVGVATLQSEIYAIGGFDGSVRLNSVEIYNLKAKTWRAAPSMQWQRSAMATAVMHEKLFVCGGYDGVASLNSIEIYDPQGSIWELGPSMGRHRSACNAVVKDECLFVMGGHDGLSIFDSVELLSSANRNVWVDQHPMQNKRCRLGVAAIDDSVFVCGGYDGGTFLNSCEVMNMERGSKWSYICPMKTQRSRVAVVANWGMLWAVGGYDGSRNLNTVEIYDPRSNEWNWSTPMTAHEGGVGLTVLPLAGALG